MKMDKYAEAISDLEDVIKKLIVGPAWKDERESVDLAIQALQDNQKRLEREEYTLVKLKKPLEKGKEYWIGNDGTVIEKNN